MDQDEEGGIQNSKSEQVQPHIGTTLLPAPIANAVSLVTRSSALYLHLGTFVGGLALDGARATTLTGLELSRAVLESILSRAGRDVTDRSRGKLGRLEAEGLLERSIAFLHSTITQISFAASTSFYFSSTALSSTVDLSQHLLATLDSILGSTDSSRAIASITTLIRREFQNPATGQPGEKVGVVDLLLGLCGLVLLQRWCKRLTNLEAREKGFEDIVCWDVVILDDGRRADVIPSIGDHEVLSSDVINNVANDSTDSMPSISNNEILKTIRRQTGAESGQEVEWPGADFKEQIMSTLPSDAGVSITTETMTTKIITVEITGAQPPDLSPPPGVEILEETAHHTNTLDLDGQLLTNEQKIGLLVPRYRVVYRMIQNKLLGTSITSDSPACYDNEQSDREIINVSSESTPKGATRAIEAIYTSPDTQLGTATVSYTASNLTPLPSLQLDGQSVQDKHIVDPFEGLRDQEFPKMAPLESPDSPSQVANQKRTRRPMSIMSNSSSISGSDNPRPRKISGSRPPLPKKFKSDAGTKKSAEKKSSLQNALRKSPKAAISSIWNKGQSVQDTPSTTDTKPSQTRPSQGVNMPTPSKHRASQLPIPQHGSSVAHSRESPRAPRRGNPNYFSSRDLGLVNVKELPRSPSHTSFYSVHESRRDSLVSQTDTYSIQSTENRPPSPTAVRTHLKAQSSILRSRSEKNITIVPASQKNHRRAKSHVPSIYTLKTNNSETSLVLTMPSSKGAFENAESLKTLIRTGNIDGIFPQNHIVHNMARFVRFASASYGASFMRVMGISAASEAPTPRVSTEHHHEHHSFSHHTQLPASTILLSSFVDPQGGSDSTGQTNTGIPMVHFVSLDHESRAVVLSCRGTLGFEDILTDMTCDYDDLILRGKTYKVHKGIHSSALRLLSGNGSRVLTTLAAALEEFPNYGLVMCGHSLGGGVTSLLAIMISEPGTANSSFVTAANYQHSQPQIGTTTNPGAAPRPPIRLPPGRPIHVYAYGPPAAVSPSLRLATRGLITTIVNGQDVVPYLSLGVLHDMQAVALAFKTDDSGAKHEVRSRVWAGLTSGFADKWYGNREASAAMPGTEDDDRWAYAALKALRASMLSAKLVPPGEVFIVETVPVLQRDAFTAGGGEWARGKGLGSPATRAILKHVRDVERRFGELRFGGSMLLDHSPGRYEASLGALGKGVLGF